MHPRRDVAGGRHREPLVDTIIDAVGKLLTIPSIDAATPYPVVALSGLVWRTKIWQSMGKPAPLELVHTTARTMDAKDNAPVLWLLGPGHDAENDTNHALSADHTTAAVEM